MADQQLLSVCARRGGERRQRRRRSGGEGGGQEKRRRVGGRRLGRLGQQDEMAGALICRRLRFGLLLLRRSGSRGIGRGSALSALFLRALSFMPLLSFRRLSLLLLLLLLLVLVLVVARG
jgi:hypothetical protein